MRFSLSSPVFFLLVATLFSLTGPLPAQSPQGGTSQSYSVGTGCDYTDLQAAINAADADGVFTELRLRAETFAGNFSIFGQDLVIRGGYADCDPATNPTSVSTLDGENSGRPLLVGNSLVNSEVFLENLFIENGNTTGDGGGIYVNGIEADHELTLDNVTVRFNQADGNGGGIALFGDANMRLTLRDNTTLLGNDAGVSGSNGAGEGGGVFCRGRDGEGLVSLQDAIVSLNSSENEGGGLALQDCVAVSDGPGEISFNQAGSVGGGIAAAGASRVLINGGGEFSVAGNQADEDGGGIWAGLGAEVELIDVTVRDNSADVGGAFYLRDQSSLVMSRSPGGQCASGIECSVIRGNTANTAGVASLSDASAHLLQTVVRGNSASSATSVAQVLNGGEFKLSSALVHGNGGGPMFRVILDGSLEVTWSTIADNPSESGSSAIVRLLADDVETSSLQLVSSIFRNAGRDVLDLSVASGSNYSTEFDCLVSNELATLTGFTRSFVDDPEFVDAAADDYHVQTSSPVIDACDATNPPAAPDIDGDMRGRDYGTPSPVDYDIGVDEVWFGIFSDRFEQ